MNEADRKRLAYLHMMREHPSRHINANKVLKKIKTDSTSETGSRFLLPNGKFTHDEGTHEDIIRNYSKELDFTKDGTEDHGTEFLNKTGSIRTMVDHKGKFSYGKPTLWIEAYHEPTEEQFRAMRKLIKETDLPEDEIHIDQGHGMDYKEFNRKIGLRRKY